MIATSTSNHNVLLKHSVTNYFLVMVVTPILFFVKYQCIIFLPFLTTISNYKYNNTLNQKKKIPYLRRLFLLMKSRRQESSRNYRRTTQKSAVRVRLLGG